MLAGVVEEVIVELALGLGLGLEDWLAVGAALAPHPASARVASAAKLMWVALTISLKPPDHEFNSLVSYYYVL